MQTAGQLLAGKSTLDVCTIYPDATVFDAIKVFAEQNLGALIVTEGGVLKGLITERDYARKVILQGRSSKETKVRDIMTSRIIFVDPETTIDQCMSIMLHKYIRHLPVVDDDRLIGIISMGDVVRAVLEKHEETIGNLVDYITDSPMTSREIRTSTGMIIEETTFFEVT
jgi:CBS domain-containing protein